MSSKSSHHKEGVYLLPGKEFPALSFHSWVFSGAIRKIPSSYQDGSYVSVFSDDGRFLGKAFLNRKSSIALRFITFQDIPLEEALSQNISEAISFRKELFSSFSGKMCRLINAEADLLSGLIVDLYDTCCVIQISSYGMFVNKECIVRELRKNLDISWVYEKSTSPSLSKEGLLPFEGTVYGVENPECIVSENGLRFYVSIAQGQKTGFFIDQRENREVIYRLSENRHVLNCCCYSGAFTVAALKGNAASCTSLDVSKKALEDVERNIQLNDLSSKKHTKICEDLFSYIKNNPLPYDLVILDPPAFAKRKQDIRSALSGYRQLNQTVLEKLPEKSFLLTCSCSYHILPEQFYDMIKAAAKGAGRQVRLLSYHRHAWDHPTRLEHPETDYLKSALLYVS